METNNTTLQTIQSLLISFEDNYHLPALSSVNNAHRLRSPESLCEAAKAITLAADALEHLERRVTLLATRSSAAFTEEEVWKLAGEVEELASSLEELSSELTELCMDVLNDNENYS